MLHPPPRLHALAERDGVTLSELIEKKLEKASERVRGEFVIIT